MPFHSRALFLASAAGLLALSACGGQNAADDPEAERKSGRYLFAEAGSAGPEWLTYGGTYDEQRYSLLESVTPANVSRLGLAWVYDLRSDRGVEATPIEHDGVLYVTAAWSVVHAINAETGELLWIYDPEVDRALAASACCGVAGRGVAWKNGVLYLGVLDGRLEAIDAGSGRRLWSVQTADRARPYTILGAPRVVKNMVLIGNGGAGFGVRGYLSAYDAATGKLVWRFYTVPNPNKRLDGAASDNALTGMANATWGNSGAWKTEGGGGPVADSIVYDVRNDQVVFGVGGGSPANAALRDPNGFGDNLFLSSIVAVDADSGQYRWHYQETPRDNWGYAATQSIVLADLPLGDAGASRRVLLQAAGNGFFYVLDAATGEYVSGKGFVPQSWTNGLDPDGRPVDAAGARPPAGGAHLLWPGLAGARGFEPMAFSPKLGLAYMPVREIPELRVPLEKADPLVRPNSGFAAEAGVPLAPLDAEALQQLRAAASNSLVAWDPVKQEARWTVKRPAAGSGGLLATASGLLFQGAADGYFSAYNAANGQRLWRQNVKSGIAAPPISYERGERQYVVVATGLGGRLATGAGYLFDRPVADNRGLVLAFRLGGTARLPDAPKGAARPSDAPEVAARLPGAPKAAAAPFGDVALQQTGRVLYSRNCAACHGAMAISSGVLPDLRWALSSGDVALWRAAVLEGAGVAGGMPDFGKRLAAADAEAVRAYVLLQANGSPESKAAEKTAAKTAAKAPAKRR